VNLPEESQEYEIKIGAAPLRSEHGMGNFVGSMKNFVYYRSTKYNEMVRGDRKCMYIIIYTDLLSLILTFLTLNYLAMPNNRAVIVFDYGKRC
jgi:hypothetical protein